MAQKPPSEFLLTGSGIQHRVPRRTVSTRAAQAFLTPLTGRGFPHGEPLVVDLLMAVGVEEHAVLDRVLAARGPPHNVTAVPPR